MTPGTVPTVLVTGSVGSGKTAVADEIAVLLHEQAIPHALLDLDRICQAYPAPADDPYRHELMLKNLTTIWPNYRAEGIHYLVLARVIEDRDDLARYREAIPEADTQVVRVPAPPELVRERLEKREVGSFYDHLWQRSQELSLILDEAEVEDLVVSNDERPVREVAAEIMTKLGWPTPDYPSSS
jgi:adenylylsulfate kinase